ncbi:MAG: Ig-like domain-containing protein [Patescibacteria group bacterium]|nr:Ig-like domain-containing protein [Patescibacteria group bacterium]
MFGTGGILFLADAQVSNTDIIPPNITITNPIANSVVSNTVNITAFATDIIKVAGVKFFVDDKTIGYEDFYPPYSASWYTRDVNNGFHVLTAQARDSAGNKATSSIFVDVQNVTSTKFSINDQIVAIANIYVRPEPSLSSKALAMLFNGSKGTVMGGPAFASKYFWWQVKFDNGLTGWVVENYLIKQAVSAVSVSSTLAIVSYSVATTTVNTVKIIWQTNIPADGQVECGTSLVSMSSTLIYSSFVTTHAVFVSGLVPNTSYIYRIRSKDKLGNLALSPYGNFTTKVSSDSISPVVSVSSPLNNSVIYSTSSLVAQASDNVKMGGVQFFIDGKTIGSEDATLPYSVVWDSRTVLNGSHVITAKARDAVGNQSFSDPVSIIVDNKLSTKFSINDQIVAIANIYVRPEPSLSSKALAMLFNGSKGTVMGGPAFASKYFWWQVKFDNGLTGWVAENWVVKADIISPVISFISPQNNSNVSGTVAISVLATDNVGVYRVEFYRNNVIVGTDFSSPYGILWNTKGFVAGQYVLNAKAYDAAGNVGVSSLLTVNILGSGVLDTISPFISITFPTNNSTVSSTVNITANASDNIGVLGVQFKLDGSNLGLEDITSPYSISWNTASSTNGTHTIFAVARDAAGNISSSSVTVDVLNSVSSTFRIINHDYPRILDHQWGGGNADWFSRFDLIKVPPTKVNNQITSNINVMQQLKVKNPNTITLATTDWNGGGYLRTIESMNNIPPEWRLRRSDGSYILAYSTTYMADITNYGVRITETVNGYAVNNERYNEALPRVIAETTDWSLFDGVASDGSHPFPWKANGDIDIDRNGVNDYTEHGEAWIKQKWWEGQDAARNKLRDYYQQKFGSRDAKYITYWTVGTGSNTGMSVTTSNGVGWEAMFINSPTSFSSWPSIISQWESTGPLPRINYVTGDLIYDDSNYYDYPNTPSRPKEYYRFFRWTLGIALLNDVYYAASENGGRWRNYYDEFDTALGYPKGAAHKLSNSAYIRCFDNGAVLVNPTNAAVTITNTQLQAYSECTGTYYRFKGNQDPNWNNGVLFDSVTLISTVAKTKSGSTRPQNVGDAIILLKTPRTVVSDIIIDNVYSGTSAGSVEATLSGFTYDSEAQFSSTNPLWATARWDGGSDTLFSGAYSRGHYAPAGSGSATAIFKPTINVPGQYALYEWHGWKGSSSSSYTEASNVPVQIKHAGGTTNLVINQQINYGQWNLLGTYTFNNDGTSQVSLSNNANGYVIADAFKFEYIGL